MTTPNRGSGELDALLDQLREYVTPQPPWISLPPRAFTSPELYELELDRIFRRSWIMVARADQLAGPGDYLALTIAGEPLLLTRDRTGALNAMSPICRHRMMPVVAAGAGRAEHFTCPYHLWRYGLDGQLIAATHMRGNPAFDPGTCRLPGFAVEQWQGFVFVNLDSGAPPLRTHLSRIGEDLGNYELGAMTQVGSFVEDWHCNWKVAVENVHENYHVMGFHPETIQPSTPGGSDTDVRDDSPLVLRFTVPFKEPQEVEFLRLTEQERRQVYNVSVFPCTSFAAAGETVIWLSFIPTAIDRTEVRGGILAPSQTVEGTDAEQLQQIREGNEAYAAVINGEDQRGLEEVQRAVGSRFAGRGHLSPKEPAVPVFYRKLAAALLAEEYREPAEAGPLAAVQSSLS
ncbi:aromatic ring-hydroxylating dioxygenase subunit alpha [Micromonospora aurantiaca]|uniref:aromatic ring-hydroxylating oxygenase subunit alpha n=1 Tax=Micromonospora aurantiaca (nom. illeg.) TaxID=47850 RepID=UPI00160E9C8C|nr:aromatic ring-hydroxylating dioxygenase subunit alpha [Micromonospora aurantiaca]UFN92290.1 aromatic ring-hydroxylating dioxygenase subunit alpha [Micromonospora aurantiaca]